MNFRLSAFIFVLLSGCQIKNNSPQSSSTTDTTQRIEIIRQKQIAGFYKWTGNLNSSIPVFMWFAVRDSVIKGELTYLKTKRQLSITILGIITGEGFKIHEFQKDGTITGTFIGKLTGKEFKGNWYAPSSGKELSFQFASKDTIFNSVDTSLNPTDISGEYSYQFGKAGSQGGIDIKQIDKNLASFDISCVTSAPGFNVANVNADSVRITNNEIDYRIPDSENCQFRIRVFKDFLVINYVDKQYDCGFGLNADVEGIFMKKK